MKNKLLNSFDIARLIQVNIEQYFIVKSYDKIELRYITPRSGIVARFGEVDIESIKEFDLYPVAWSPNRSHFCFTPVLHSVDVFN